MSWMEGIWINLTTVQIDCKCRKGLNRHCLLHACLFACCIFACTLVSAHHVCMCAYCLHIISLHAHCVCISCLHACLYLHIISLNMCFSTYHVFGRLYKKPHSTGYFGRRELRSWGGKLILNCLFFIHLKFCQETTTMLYSVKSH